MEGSNDKTPIVDEMETEYSEAVNTEVVRLPSSPNLPNPDGSSNLSCWSFHVKWTFVRSCLNTLVYTLLGGSGFVLLWFGITSPVEMTIFQWHIVLSVIGEATKERQELLRTGGGKPPQVPPSVAEDTDWLRSIMSGSIDGNESIYDDDVLPNRSEPEPDLDDTINIAAEDCDMFHAEKYQLLMPYAMMGLQTDGWASALPCPHRRRAHWVMQLLGSVLAFIGSVIMMAHKTVNFNSLHGKFALAALLFTIASLANGISSLYTRQLRRYMPPRLSILSHTLIGTLAFLLSSVCLIYGYLKHSFTGWASREFAYVLISVTCCYTFIICWPPTFKVSRQVFQVIKEKMFS